MTRAQSSTEFISNVKDVAGTRGDQSWESSSDRIGDPSRWERHAASWSRRGTTERRPAGRSESPSR